MSRVADNARIRERERERAFSDPVTSAVKMRTFADRADGVKYDAGIMRHRRYPGQTDEGTYASFRKQQSGRGGAGKIGKVNADALTNDENAKCYECKTTREREGERRDQSLANAAS